MKIYILITQYDTDNYRIMSNPDGSLWYFTTRKDAKIAQSELLDIHDIECSIKSLTL